MTRYIDADVLLQRVNEVTMIGSYLRTWLNVVISEQPTVKLKPIEVPKPVRHGRWKKAEPHGVWVYSDAYRQCSECNDVIYLAFKMQYCPTCGTKMENKNETD